MCDRSLAVQVVEITVTGRMEFVLEGASSDQVTTAIRVTIAPQQQDVVTKSIIESSNHQIARPLTLMNNGKWMEMGKLYGTY